MYDLEAKSPVTLVGAGIGLDNPAVERIPLSSIKARERDAVEEADNAEVAEGSGDADQVPLTIAEAKRRLAMTFGVDPSAIKIIVEG